MHLMYNLKLLVLTGSRQRPTPLKKIIRLNVRYIPL